MYREIYDFKKSRYFWVLPRTENLRNYIRNRKSVGLNVCLGLLYNLSLKNLSFQDEVRVASLNIYTGLHVNCPLFSSDFNEI
jgi:hypothetical protein